MPKFRYEGQEPARYGSRLVEPGQILEMPSAPNKNYKPVKDVKARAKKQSAASTITSEGEGSDEKE